MCFLNQVVDAAFKMGQKQEGRIAVLIDFRMKLFRKLEALEQDDMGLGRLDESFIGHDIES
jgi:hypothetical protein